MQRLHLDGQYCIGQDCGIYGRETEPLENGAVAPDWFYVPGVPPLLDGKIRRSYVLWREYITPTIALEFAFGHGSEERDRTPLLCSTEGEAAKPGKFWVYKRIMHIPFYGIYQVNNGNLEVYHLIEGLYQKMAPNERGHYPITPMQVELGLWHGTYQNQPEQLWLRSWDFNGNLLLIGFEEAERERQKKEQALEQVDQERQQRQQLTEKLRSLSPDQLNALGINPADLE